ncbi:hypothetical protein C8Q74DRAFT_1288939 [Fomes fomentarius]|nr:hypothetical protein C8Q74DRAFT_1288939 [Fomes fomentarius]
MSLSGQPKSPSLKSLVDELPNQLLTERDTLRPHKMLDIIVSLRRFLAEDMALLMGTYWANEIPEDILVEIFNHCLDGDRRGTTFAVSRDYDARINTVPLLRLTHVCRTWRAVALANPAFWTRVDGCNTLQRDAYLARSQSLPLSMFLTDKHPIPNLNTFLCTYAHRLQRLDLIIETSELRALSFPVSEGMLESVIITEVTNPKFLTHAVRVEDVPQQFVLFDRPVLHLKALAISSMSGWPTNHYPNLTHLYISLWHSQPSIGGIEYWDVSAIVHLFSETPMLTFLHIDHLVDLCYDEDVIASTTPVSLDNLRSVVFTYSAIKDVHTVISLLTIPGPAFIRLQHTYCHTHDTLLLPPFLANTLDGITALELQLSGERNPCVRVVADGPSSGFWLEAPAHEENVGTWTPWVTRNLVERFPLSQILVLTIVLSPDENEVLYRILPHMLQLSELRLRLGGPKDSARATLCTFCTLMEHEAPLLCPQLKSLTIDSNVLPLRDIFDTVASRALRGSIEPALPTPEQTHDPIMSLVQMARVRSSLGHPLSNITLQLYILNDLYRGAIIRQEFVFQVAVCIGWDIESTEDYWDLDEDQRPKYTIGRVQHVRYEHR